MKKQIEKRNKMPQKSDKTKTDIKIAKIKTCF